jgi:hypothetical protein
VEILIFMVFGTLVIGLAVLSHYLNVKRRKDLEAEAARLGWTFVPDKDHGLSLRFPNLKCLNRGSNRYAFNLLSGQCSGRPACGFDYHYETYSTDSKGHRKTSHHWFSVAMIETDLPLKPLLIRPEGFFDRIGEFFGLDDIDFESAQFSREFHVTSPDRKWAFDVIHQATMEFLLDAPRFTIELHGPRVFVYHGNCFRPNEFEVACQVATGLIDRLPNYLHREWKGTVQ